MQYLSEEEAEFEGDREEKTYEQRLQSAIDTAYRSPDGQFLLQHFVTLCGFFDSAADPFSAGRRSVAVALMADLNRNRVGKAIIKTVLGAVVDEQFGAEEQ